MRTCISARLYEPGRETQEYYEMDTVWPHVSIRDSSGLDTLA